MITAQHGVAGSDARTSVDDVGFAATLFKKPVNSQADLVKALQSEIYFPAQMGELASLRRPGDAKAEEAKMKKKKRRWVR